MATKCKIGDSEDNYNTMLVYKVNICGALLPHSLDRQLPSIPTGSCRKELTSSSLISLSQLLPLKDEKNFSPI